MRSCSCDRRAVARLFFMFAKVYPFLPELREKTGRPGSVSGCRKSGDRDEWGRERLKFILKRIEATREKKAKEAQA